VDSSQGRGDRPLKHAESVKDYWNTRASADKTAQSTTNDFYLREIESRCVGGAIAQFNPARVFDVGCGDARTTIYLAKMFPQISFLGGDYAEAMIANARNNLRQEELGNLELVRFDIARPGDTPPADFVYTTRCLINIPGWDAQKQAITNIAKLLQRGNTYVMIENFVDGHREMNTVRRSFGLSEIKIRDHNCFFEADALLPFLNDQFDVQDIQNISSSYYLVTRGIYSKLCQQQGVEPDYFDDHHKLAAQLPFCGNFGPVKMLILRKK
jgi:SAM-dependent methyltransferase